MLIVPGKVNLYFEYKISEGEVLKVPGVDRVRIKYLFRNNLVLIWVNK